MFGFGKAEREQQARIERLQKEFDSQVSLCQSCQNALTGKIMLGFGGTKKTEVCKISLLSGKWAYNAKMVECSEYKRRKRRKVSTKELAEIIKILNADIECLIRRESI